MMYSIIVGCFIVSLLLIRKWLMQSVQQKNISEELVSWLKDVSRRVEDNSKHVDSKLTQNMDMFNARLDQASQTMLKVERTIGEFSEIGRSMQELQTLLQSPKLRGNLGEHILHELLAQCLPPEYFTLQFQFHGGEKVDAIIKTSNGMIPIDSKFPLTTYKKMIDEKNTDPKKLTLAFQQEVKIHIKSISQKYIRTDEGTVDYALMYIPTESVYYEIIQNIELYEYASTLRIIPVSPISFYAYLRVLMLSYEGVRIQKEAKHILATIQSMKKEYEKLDEGMMLLHRHLTNAYNQSTNVLKNSQAFGQKIHNQLFAHDTQNNLIE